MKQYVPKHQTTLFVGLLVLVLIILQWPMLKGMFYRVSGAPAPEDGIPWRTDFNTALAEARQTGKPVLMDFSATWCPPCQVMRHDVWPDPQVAQLASQSYIPMLVDVDRDGPLAERYDVSTIPTILIVDAEGKVLHSASYLSRDGMVDFLHRWASAPATQPSARAD